MLQHLTVKHLSQTASNAAMLGDMQNLTPKLLCTLASVAMPVEFQLLTTTYSTDIVKLDFFIGLACMYTWSFTSYTSGP